MVWRGASHFWFSHRFPRKWWEDLTHQCLPFTDYWASFTWVHFLQWKMINRTALVIDILLPKHETQNLKHSQGWLDSSVDKNATKPSTGTHIFGREGWLWTVSCTLCLTIHIFRVIKLKQKKKNCHYKIFFILYLYLLYK